MVTAKDRIMSRGYNIVAIACALGTSIFFGSFLTELAGRPQFTFDAYAAFIGGFFALEMFILVITNGAAHAKQSSTSSKG